MRCSGWATRKSPRACEAPRTASRRCLCSRVSAACSVRMLRRSAAGARVHPGSTSSGEARRHDSDAVTASASRTRLSRAMSGSAVRARASMSSSRPAPSRTSPGRLPGRPERSARERVGAVPVLPKSSVSSSAGRRDSNAGSPRSASARVAFWKPARSNRVLGEELCREGAPTGGRLSLWSLTAASCCDQARGKNWLSSKSVTWAS